MIHHHAQPSFVALAAMWQGMMVLMMAPVVWPWLRVYRQLATASAVPSGSRAGPAGRVGWRTFVPTASFGAGYLTTWMFYSLVAASVQLLALRGGATRLDALAPGVWRGGILAAAGLYQFAPLKRACLRHCRNPLTYFLRQWRGGPAGGFRLGASHGLYCVGCCWILMLTALAVGMTNLWWMAALAAATFLEQSVPRAQIVRVPLGLMLLVGGVRLALG